MSNWKEIIFIFQITKNTFCLLEAKLWTMNDENKKLISNNVSKLISKSYGIINNAVYISNVSVGFKNNENIIQMSFHNISLHD